jgi:hypothetical protein
MENKEIKLLLDNYINYLMDCDSIRLTNYYQGVAYGIVLTLYFQGNIKTTQYRKYLAKINKEFYKKLRELEE